MNRQLSILSALTALLLSWPIDSALAHQGFGQGKGHGSGVRHGHGLGRSVGHHGRGFGGKFGFHHGAGFNGFGPGFGGGFVDIGWDLAELYRELHDNIPHFALHPPVYYSRPVPRTYGYSPFAYPPYIMTPEIACDVQPHEIINPHVPESEPNSAAAAKTDRTAAAARQVEPLVIENPFVVNQRQFARSTR